MTNLLTLDPGTRGAGVAVFVDRDLVGATYVHNPCREGRRLNSAVTLARAVRHWAEVTVNRSIHRIAIEVMRSYEAGQQKGPQDDLIDVSLVSAAVAGTFHDVRPELMSTFYPQEWKGSVKAETFLGRILDRLESHEKAAIKLVGRIPLAEVPKSDSLDHNTLDAIGIGLKVLGRLERHRAYARE